MWRSAQDAAGPPGGGEWARADIPLGGFDTNALPEKERFEAYRAMLQTAPCAVTPLNCGT